MTTLKTKQTSKRDARLEKMRERIANQKSNRALNLLVDADLLKRFKVKVASVERTMTDVVTDMIQDYVKD
jgi:hypothetical protein